MAVYECGHIAYTVIIIRSFREPLGARAEACAVVWFTVAIREPDTAVARSQGPDPNQRLLVVSLDKNPSYASVTASARLAGHH